MNLQQLLLALVHEDAAAVIRHGYDPPEREVKAVVIVGRLRLVLGATTYEGPAHIYLAPGVDPGAIPGAIPSPPAPLPEELSDLEKRIMKAAPTDARVSMKKLARAAKSGYHWHFRAVVNKLVDAGLLSRASTGIRRT